MINILGDAPPRGFCDVKLSWCSPINANDKAGPQAYDLFKSIDDKCMKYNVLQSDDKQDVMVKGFAEIAKKFGGDTRFQVYDMKKSLNFDEVTKSIIASINAQLTKTNDYLNSRSGKKDRCIAV